MGLDVGQVLSRAFEMFKSRLGPLVGLWLVFFVIQLAAMFLFSAATGFGAMAAGTAGNFLDDGGSMAAGFILWFGLFYVMYLLIYAAQSTSMSAMASPLLSPSFGDSFSRGIRSAPTFVAVLVLLIIIYLLLAVIVSLILAGLGSVSSVLSAIFGIALIPLAIYLACRMSVISAVIGVEQQLNPVKAIMRTWSMTKGNVIGIFLTLLVFIVGIVIMVAILFFAGFGSMIAAFEGGAGPGITVIILVFVLFIASAIVLTVLGAALISSLHEALSGHDGEDLAETFG